jgi:Fe-S-cluster containining protein
MNDPSPAWPVLKGLIEKSAPIRRQLKNAYALIPQTRCQRRARCCLLLPEMTFIEALEVIAFLDRSSPEARLALLRKIVSYFFINPTAITACPFLQEPECLIYSQRFLGCRAYGLWSADTYEQLTRQNRQSKAALSEQWKNMGITLPQEVVEFKVPYCTSVERDHSLPFDDENLEQIEESIEHLSEKLKPWHEQFRNDYFSDLAFFLAGLFLGRLPAVRQKFFIVKEILDAGRSKRLTILLDGLKDPFQT